MIHGLNLGLVVEILQLLSGEVRYANRLQLSRLVGRFQYLPSVQCGHKVRHRFAIRVESPGAVSVPLKVSTKVMGTSSAWCVP